MIKAVKAFKARGHRQSPLRRFLEDGLCGPLMRVGPDPGCILANHLLDMLLGDDLLVRGLFEVADTVARRVPD